MENWGKKAEIIGNKYSAEIFPQKVLPYYLLLYAIYMMGIFLFCLFSLFFWFDSLMEENVK